MSKQNKIKKKLEQQAAKQAQLENTDKVLMIFSEDKFYNDLDNPIYRAGQVYEIIGAANIERWLKRGGKIVQEGEGKSQEAQVNIKTAEDFKPETSSEDEVETELEPVLEDYEDEYGEDTEE